MTAATASEPRTWRGPVAGGAAAALTLIGYYAAGMAGLEAVGWGCVALVGAHLALGLDPPKPKPKPVPVGWTVERVATVLAEARAQVAAIDAANRDIPSPEATAVLHRITDRAGAVIALFERDPTDIDRGRKFLDVYLAEVVRIAKRYAETHTLTACADLDRQFLDLLLSVADTFEDTRAKLLQDDKLSLDVDMTVLRKRLNREGA
jgi:hypothetical protein